MKQNLIQQRADQQSLGSQSDQSSQRRRHYNKAERLLDERLDDLAIENFDEMNSYPGDCHDELTNTKIKGFVDQEKLDEWKFKMKSVFKRRLHRKKEQSADANYFTEKRTTEKEFTDNSNFS